MMSGLHHVTTIAGNALNNFTTRTLGLRFFKKTVNFDDPGTYHFYYGGRPAGRDRLIEAAKCEEADPNGA